MPPSKSSQDVAAAFANRAHNDFAELFLETGLIGICVITFFSIWLVRRSYAVWSRHKTDEDPGQSLLLRASTLIVVLLLAHSLVDYPLRTTALSAVFAVFCGFLAAPVPAPYHDAPKSCADEQILESRPKKCLKSLKRGAPTYNGRQAGKKKTKISKHYWANNSTLQVERKYIQPRVGYTSVCRHSILAFISYELYHLVNVPLKTHALVVVLLKSLYGIAFFLARNN